MHKWLSIIQFVLPIVLSTAAPGLAPLAPALVHAIGASEAMHGATGHEKLQNAIGLVSDAVDIANGIAVAKGLPPLMDKDQVLSAAGEVVSATVDVANVIHRLPGTQAQLAAPPPVGPIADSTGTPQ